MFVCCRYVSPDYASTGMLNEGSDVYSFGILLMEIITGRSPVDYSRPPGEVTKKLLLSSLTTKLNSVIKQAVNTLVQISDELGRLVQRNGGKPP